MKANRNLFLMLMNDEGNLALTLARIYTSVKKKVKDDCLRVHVNGNILQIHLIHKYS